MSVYQFLILILAEIMKTYFQNITFKLLSTKKKIKLNVLGHAKTIRSALELRAEQRLNVVVRRCSVVKPINHIT